MSEKEERDRKARIRSNQATQQRLAKAIDHIAIATTQEAVEIDKMGHEVAIGQYTDAEDHVMNALGLIRDCRRSIEGRGE